MNPYVFDISRGSLHDGPGVRTVVYLKGCSLACKWCHNPEGLSPEKQVLFHQNRCINCGRCLTVCPEHHVLKDGQHVYLRENCKNCFACCEVCPSDALAVCGKSYTPEELFREIMKDTHYFKQSDGGLTVSGGEALLYPDFIKEIFLLAHAQGIHTAIETALNVPLLHIKKVLEHIDLFIADLKHHSSAVHKQLTGCGNERILNNFEYLASHHKNIWVRIPCIPTCNDDDENLIRSVQYINTLGSAVKRVELLRYNNLADNKYTSVEIEPTLLGLQPQSNEAMDKMLQLIKPYLPKDTEVVYS